ncbi:MAG: CAP domain-containing protein [Bacteroidetes bacterium]|nr:MAG: CAP domain-containing protein [Bacteroidota bacterium]
MLKPISFTLRIIFLSISLVIFTSAIAPATSLADGVLKYTNEFRKSKGLATLKMRSDLNAIARGHSEDMASGRSSFGHGGFNERAKKIQKIYDSFIVAENVIYGASNAKEAVRLWKKSSGHRQNMLGNYKYIGIGTARNKHGVVFYTQIFVN